MERGPPGPRSIDPIRSPPDRNGTPPEGALEAIAAWRQRAEHLAAKDSARRRWVRGYATRIARVEHAH